jgi:hypothetical protein
MSLIYDIQVDLQLGENSMVYGRYISLSIVNRCMVTNFPLDHGMETEGGHGGGVSHQ